MIVVIVAIVLATLTVAFVAYPLFRGVRATGNPLDQDSELDGLVAQREASLLAIKDLDFDFQTGKLSEEDYRELRGRYAAKAVSVLQELDRRAGPTPELEEEIEQEVRQLRQKGEERRRKQEAGGRRGEKELSCPRCGRAYQAGDRFCAGCGAALATVCPRCSTPYKPGDRFCAGCGGKLELSTIVVLFTLSLSLLAGGAMAPGLVSAALPEWGRLSSLPGQPGKAALPTFQTSSQAQQATPTPSPPAGGGGQEGGNGRITGQVTNGTAGAPADSLRQVQMILYPFLDQTVQQPISRTTDAAGAFAFDSLGTGPGRGYVVLARYQGVDYFAGDGLLDFSQENTTVPLTVTVYETSTSDAAVRIERNHMIVVPVEGDLQVTEIVIFSNDSDRTYIGSETFPGSGSRETLRLALPPGADDLQFQDPGMTESIALTTDGFVDSLPLAPGPREMLFAYVLSYASPTYRLVKTASYPTANFNLLVADVGAKVSSSQLATQSPLVPPGGGQGERYLHLAGQNLARGSQVVIDFSALPQPGASQPGSAAGVSAGGDQEALKWAGAILAVLALALAGSYPLWRRRRAAAWERKTAAWEAALPVAGAPVTVGQVSIPAVGQVSIPAVVSAAEESLESRRQELLLALARLDDRFEAGDIAEEEYRQQRAEKKAELIAVMRAEPRRMTKDEGRKMKDE
jgi:hypothetical protein